MDKEYVDKLRKERKELELFLVTCDGHPVFSDILHSSMSKYTMKPMFDEIYKRMYELDDILSKAQEE